MTFTFSCPSAWATGLRERTETFETVGVTIICCNTAEPTRPVAPVRTRCIVCEGDLDVPEEMAKEFLKERGAGEEMGDRFFLLWGLSCF